MQLDKTAIVIAQRTGVELIDLSLIVMRCYWRPLLLFAFLGILPFAILDSILLYPLCQYDLLVMSSINISDAEVYHFRYLWIVTAVILIQSPLALCGVTYFIGQAVFIERPSIRQVFASVWSRWGAILFVVGLLRCSLVVFVPMVFLFMDPIFRPELEIPMYLLLLCGFVVFVRGFRPFATEILLLERCPIFKWKNRPEQLGYSKRSSWLHANLSFELFSAHLGVALVQALTALSLSAGMMFAIGVLTGIWRWGPWMDFLLYPLVVWTIATWGTVIRFLLYMNSRIRTEGWEIELRLKAESQRLEEATT
jgi:hypothetical protein